MKLTVLFIGLGLLTSCSKSDTTPTSVVPPVTQVDIVIPKKDTTEDVYIVGQTSSQAGYFKNSQFISIATGTNPLATDMAFSGTDIYVLGQINDSIGYWKNGQFNFLVLADDYLPVSIAIVGTDVFSLLQGVNGNWAGELYQNTDFNSELPTSNSPGLTTLYAKGANLYVPGSNTGIHSNAVYWLNGIANQLPITVNPGHAYDIAVDGTDVYAVGSVYDYTDSTEIATYWKDNVPYYLSDSLSYGRIYFVTVVNGIPYMAGYEATGNAFQFTGPVTAVVWKNGVATNITEPGFTDNIEGLAVNGSDVYVSVITSVPGSANGIPRYYKNGVAVNYTGTAGGYGTRIFVRSR
ncbi:MAG TPA: hypothetical protein VGI38_12865 [Puia sp.]